MTVKIETATGYRSTAELDGTELVMDAKPEALFRDLTEVRVWGDGYRKYYFGAAYVEMPSTDGKYHFKLVNPISQAERIKNLEEALVELYELLEV